MESAELLLVPVRRSPTGSPEISSISHSGHTFSRTTYADITATNSDIIVARVCGIAAGTMFAVLGALCRAARAGAIIKGGKYLEALAASKS